MNKDQTNLAETNLADEFDKWMRERHLTSCVQCKKEGKARLMDGTLVAVLDFKTFYSSYLKGI